MKRILAAAASVLTLLLCLFADEPRADADVGGEVPSPGLCDYPGVGTSAMIGAGPFGNVYTYYCDFPTEINGSHWHAELGGAAVQAALSAGVTLSFLNISGSISGNLGIILGSTSWRCPDMTLAEAPNPPGAWKSHITASKCKTIGANPDIPPAPAAADQIAPPAPDHASPAVTNPDNPNPDATVNSPR